MYKNINCRLSAEIHLRSTHIKISVVNPLIRDQRRIVKSRNGRKAKYIYYKFILMHTSSELGALIQAPVRQLGSLATKQFLSLPLCDKGGFLHLCLLRYT